MIILPTTRKLADTRYAEDEDLASLRATVTGDPDAVMSDWHLVHIDVGTGDVHALGWLWGDVYITSPVKALDAERQVIKTRSGRVYRLGDPGNDGDMRVPLLHHLVYALTTWGYRG